jgi:protein AbiQ
MDEKALCLCRGLSLLEAEMRFVTLSDDFYSVYGSCKEILEKSARPYACLAVQINGHTFAIPFRHHINHKHAFITTGEQGLDYTKAVVIENPRYIDRVDVQIESKDFAALKGKEHKVVAGFRRYISDYKTAAKYPTNKHYASILRYSTLQYFKKFL